jgi:penicillin-binding protein 1B
VTIPGEKPGLGFVEVTEVAQKLQPRRAMVRGGPTRRLRKKGRWAKRGRYFFPVLGMLVILLVMAVWLLRPFWQLSEQLTTAGRGQPSRLYAAPLRLEAGTYRSPKRVVEELEQRGYRVTEAKPSSGEYRFAKGRLEVHLRPSPEPAGWSGGGLLVAQFVGQRIASLNWRGQEASHASLEPGVLASFLGPELREQRLLPLSDIPETLIYAVLSAEDASFFSHPGLSLRGILRAAWVNLRGGEVRQGGSTLTQQLVKNLFLTHERTWARKSREVALALVIDLRYDKRTILEAYFNEIYWGTDGTVNLMGAGAAAWAYFGKLPRELTLCETALLAAMIRSPGLYSPEVHPERARERRNWVLTRMAQLGWLEESEREIETQSPLCYSPREVPWRTAPYFADFVAEEAKRRFGIDPREEPGYSLLSTLEIPAQRAASEAISWGLEALEKGWEKGRKKDTSLQGALVSIDPRSGAILAYVGGRDYAQSQFDRVTKAERQAGSAFKPVVYAAAFESRVASPVSLVEDSPITVALAGRRWTPRNSDGDFRGWVTVRSALERSLNIPTVRVALATGLPGIVDMAHRLGITTGLKPVPALALGAFEVTPLDLATVYATFAAGGVRRPVYGIDAILDSQGQPLKGVSPGEPERAMSAEAAFITTSVLQGVIERGTGVNARRQGLGDPVAGKTGTTNDRRDSWFVGYSPDRATLVWVGYDDASATRLSGSRAALPIWTRFTWKVRPVGGYRVFSQPPGITTAVIDPASGELASGACPTFVTEVFLRGEQPTRVCRLHSSWRDWRSDGRPEWVEVKKPRGPLRWLRRVFAREKSRRPPS